jgi:hypothetical protein
LELLNITYESTFNDAAMSLHVWFRNCIAALALIPQSFLHGLLLKLYIVIDCFEDVQPADTGK